MAYDLIYPRLHPPELPSSSQPPTCRNTATYAFTGFGAAEPGCTSSGAQHPCRRQCQSRMTGSPT